MQQHPRGTYVERGEDKQYRTLVTRETKAYEYWETNQREQKQVRCN